MSGFSGTGIFYSALILAAIGTYIWFLVRTWSRGKNRG